MARRRPLRRSYRSAPRQGLARGLFRERGCQTTSWDSNVVASRTVQLWLSQGGVRAGRDFIDCANSHERGLPVRLQRGEGVSSHHQVFGLGRLVFTTTCTQSGDVPSTSVHLFQERS